MDTHNLQNKIDGLRNQTIQNGCTHEEAHTARTLLTKLQTKLNLARQAQAKPATSPQSITPPPKPTTSSKKSENKHKKKHNTKPITQTLGPESKPGSPAIRNWASL